jgi:SAM-dependent methyltransferase
MSFGVLPERVGLALDVDGRCTMVGACPCCGQESDTQWLLVPRRALRTDDYKLLHCPSCSHVWLKNRPTSEEMGRYYGFEYHKNISHAGETSPARWKRHLRVISKYKSGGSVLDIGCSSGGFLGYFRGGAWKLYGIEPSSATAERARANTGAEVFMGDVLEANYPPESFDLITCTDVLEHLFEPRQVIQKVYSWLKPRGIFYVFVPNIMSWEARVFGSYWYGLDLPRHVQHFSRNSLSVIGASAGLQEVAIVTPPGRYLEESTRIWFDDVARTVGARRAPLDLTARPGLGWRVMRKGMRLTLEALYSRLVSSCGSAPSLRAIFRKELAPASGRKPA